MTTTRKKANKKQTEIPEEKILITEQEVYNVLEFANSLYNGSYPSVFTPQLVNSRMKDITMNPLVATMDGINKALATPKESEDILIGYSQFLELTSMIYKRTLLYFSNMPSFNWSYVCKNITSDKEYSSPAYKKDLQIMQDFFDKFNAREIFQVVMKEMMRNETYFGVLRDDGDKYILQELPRQYCKIVGRWDYGLLFDFSMEFFIQPAVSLDMYPPFFKKAYKKVFLTSDSMDYNPASPLNHRKGDWTYWVQTSPEDNFFAFKLFPEIATNVPFLAPFMGDAVLQPMIRSLQLDSYIAEASKLISGQVPFLKDAKANVKDAIALDPATLGKFLALVKAGLPNAIKIISAPLDNMQAIQFDGNNTLYDSYLSTTASSSGINSRLIYTKDRQNLLETKLSLDVDQNILRPVYEMFSGILEYLINQRTKKYKFKFSMEGFNTTTDREERLNTAFKYAESGIVLEQKFASAIDMTPFDFRRMLAEGKANKFVEKLTPIIKASQTPAGGGRPAKADSDLSEGGSESREAGSNDEKSEG